MWKQVKAGARRVGEVVGDLLTDGSVKLVVGGASLVATGVVSATATVPSAADQITAITTGQAGYATVMFALALAAVGIMVGVKWIKRGRGAA